jgi:hypothetical protein
METAKDLHGFAIFLIAPGAGGAGARNEFVMETRYIVTQQWCRRRGGTFRQTKAFLVGGCNNRGRRRVLKVLKLSAQGLPQSWISLEQAVLHYAADEVRWESGGEVAVFHGGHNAVTGQQSIIRVNSIIGTRGVPRINPFNLRPGLTNEKLFARDRNICAYCGEHFHEVDLTREHIIPFAQHGQDTWMNVVTACKPCNHRKSHRTPEQAHMPLLYTPYVPSLWEDFILRNRRILADQMEFLRAHVPHSSRLRL